MIEKTEALVLRVFPFSETSHVVVWLTPDHGRLTTAVKGACRPKSPFLGQYDLFYTCELLFYRRERNGLHIAKECSPLRPRPAFRTDWRACACASYISRVISSVSLAGSRQRELYAQTSAALDFLATEGASTEFLCWFELQLAGSLGFAPQLQRCAACAAALPRAMPAVLAVNRGGLLCAGCRSQGRSVVLLTPNVIALLRRWQAAASPRDLRRTRCTGNQLLVLQENVGIFVGYHLELPPASRRIAIELMSALILPRREKEGSA